MDTITVPCTVAILTRNSAVTLPRALESVKDFAEIIICDGGSTDSTLAIAQTYGAKVIAQSPEFKDTQGRITDFAGVRNQTLAAATQPWFFFLDSDEYIHEDLREEIRTITCSRAEGAYRVLRHYVVGGVEVTCATTYPNYSPRLFAKASADKFIKTVHERITLKTGVSFTKLTRGLIMVPIDMGIEESRRKDSYYIDIEVKKRLPVRFSYLLKAGWFHAKTSLKYCVKLAYNYAFCRGTRLPLWMELDRHRYNYILMKRLARAWWRETKKLNEH